MPKRHVIVGTAGHIDHGKTALVRALTGIDTDRLEEEKRRGISIDLGFAHLDLTKDLRVGFVDVPGHERFVKNMLAGASGIDLVLMVIAAGESIKPQTREHFDICRLLGLKHGVIALTKSDVADPDLLELTRLEIEEFLLGTFLEKAPVIPVSAVTGEGLDDLRAALARVALDSAGKNAAGVFRLPIDRSFSIRGHGSVVTGTLISGTLAIDDEVEIYPPQLHARVRGLQVHGASVNRAFAGERTAVNLAGVDSVEIHRGMMLAPAGLFQATRIIDTTFELLPNANPLKHRAPVHLHAGTAEVEAQARLLASLEPLKPGARAHVRFALDEPLLLLPGDRFIVRMFSPVITIGGGVILDAAPPIRARRVQLAARLIRIEKEGLAEVVVNESPQGIDLKDLAARCGGVSNSSGFVPIGANRIANQRTVSKFVNECTNWIKSFHFAKPLLPGASKEEVRAAILPNSTPLVFDAFLAHAPDIVAEGDIVRLKTHRIAMQQDESAATEKIEALFRDAGLAVPSTTEVLARSGVDNARAKSLLQILLRDKKLVRVGADLVFHANALNQLRTTLASRAGQRFSVGDFKDWTGISRKYAIPLLEFFDRERITHREGDSRVIVQK